MPLLKSAFSRLSVAGAIYLSGLYPVGGVAQPSIPGETIDPIDRTLLAEPIPSGPVSPTSTEGVETLWLFIPFFMLLWYAVYRLHDSHTRRHP